MAFARSEVSLATPAETYGYNQPQLPAEPPPKYAWGGFLSQSWVKTSKGVHLSGPSDGKFGSLQRSEVGLFGTYAHNQYIDLRGMISSFHDGRFESGRPQINYGLIDIHNSNSDFGARLGYVSNSAGFYSEQLNIPAYRDFELAPQGTYKEAYRHFSRGGRGAQFYTKTEIGTWLLGVEWTKFRANMTDEKEMSNAFFSGDIATFGNTDIITRSIKVRNDGLGLIMRYDQNVIKANLTIKGAAPRASYFDLTIDRFGMRKYFDFGDVIVERSLFRVGNCVSLRCTKTIGGPVATNIAYRHYLTPSINLLLGWDSYYLARDDKRGLNTKKQYAAFGIPFNNHSMYAESINAGVTWKRGPFNYKAEVHHVKGQATMMATENDLRSPTLPTSYNILLLNVSYAF